MTLPNRQNLSYSGAEWIGDAPEDWDCKRLKYCVTLRDERIEGENSDKPFIGLEHIESWTGRLLTDEESSSSGTVNVFKAGDILFGKLRPYLAKVHEAKEDGISSTETFVMVPGDNLLPRYLFYWLANPLAVENINSSTYGAKMPRANWEFVGNQMQLLPTVDEQRIISRFLDRETKRIDALIEKKRRLLELLKEKRLTIITQSVTKGLDPTALMKDSDIEWLGEIPTNWDVKPLRYVSISVQTGGTPSSTGPDYFVDEGTDWFTPGDFGSGITLKSASKKLSRDAFSERAVKSFPDGSILLVGIGATLGKVGVSQSNCSANQQINAIIVTEDVVPEYLAYYLLAYRREVRVTSNASTLGILNQEQTKSLTVLSPPKDEQSRIVQFIQSQSNEIDLVAQHIERAIYKLSEYRSALIINAVTGKIDVRNESSKGQTQ